MIAPIGQSLGDRRRAARDHRRAARSRPSRSTILARRVFCRLCGASPISFSRKCGASPRSMSRVVTSAVDDVVVGHRQLGAVVAEPGHARRARRLSQRRATTISPPCFAVEADVPIGLLDHAVRLAGHDVAVVGEADVQPLPAPAAARASSCRAGRRSSRRSPPTPRTPTRCAGTPRPSRHRRRHARDMSAGITLASVVMCWWIRRPCATRRSAWLSTSPLSAATMYGPVAPTVTARARRC